jgi:hypothetical protein
MLVQTKYFRRIFRGIIDLFVVSLENKASIRITLPVFLPVVFYLKSSILTVHSFIAKIFYKDCTEIYSWNNSSIWRCPLLSEKSIRWYFKINSWFIYIVFCFDFFYKLLSYILRRCIACVLAQWNIWKHVQMNLI